ncbi:Holliday junction resolvase RuvX [Microcella sp.]|uniref:Holliday junction resolvase RuvX n=1 Tax=Microcella sp. TaxID=1913979 RepID=UPI00256B9B1C|nr:Holliday junction resolvase RuvX [Microcella sp.]MBX9470875.1 Holliday junction resolvase RuvX [Microcella sp.]
MRTGVRLGVDVGTARVGVARSDPHGMLATPVETLARRDDVVAGIRRLVDEHGAIEIVVGLPIALSGAETASTADARAVASTIADSLDVPVRLVDERLTTVSAARGLRQAGRTSKNSRSVVDQAAAVILLQHALDLERASGNPPGALVEPHES